tara:strand:+ start:7797 stop:8375 length:579 start_codon:yes stop_codon:yes gene_type:complete
MAAVGPSGSGGGGGGEDPYIFEIDEGATRALYGGGRYGYVGQPPREWFEATVHRNVEPVSETAARSGTAKSRRIEAAAGFVPGEEVLPDRPHQLAIGRPLVEDEAFRGYADETYYVDTAGVEFFNVDTMQDAPGNHDDTHREYGEDIEEETGFQSIYTAFAPVYPETPPVEGPPIEPGMARLDLMLRQLGFK